MSNCSISQSYDGHTYWWYKRLLHRIDGPAIEHADGSKEWYLNGVSYSFERFLQVTPLSDKEKLMLALTN